MALLTVRPTRLDEAIAEEVAVHTDRPTERVTKALTWGADEHVLLALAAVGWILTRASPEPKRRLGTHVLACTLTTAILPHIMKVFIDQKRPDRLTIKGHLRGIPLSGKAEDAFPSGHALHVGALASAATLLPPKFRDAVWVAGAVLVTTRIILLAHWFTDVVVEIDIDVLTPLLPRTNAAGPFQQSAVGVVPFVAADRAVAANIYEVD
jgi:4-amino-4-deoxy-L-arabinose transferase-like glycosyltransferase